MTTREDTMQDYQRRIERVLRFIREHQSEPMRLKELAEVACFSPFHFHRIFSAHAGETLSEYIRRLRLESSAERLCRTTDAVTEIALDAGYATHGAFTKAFTQHFGRNPSSFRKTGKMDFVPGRLLMMSKQKETEMKVQIREIQEQAALAVRRTGAYDKAAEEAWKILCTYAGPKGLMGPKTKFIGISHDDPDQVAAENLRYDACITLSRDDKGSGDVKRLTIGGGRYAVTVHAGPFEYLKKTYDGIYRDWLPSSGETLRDAACLEIYLNDPDTTPPADLRTEVCIPLE
ncbi:MAG TPA: AraC family transcriptional regulator [Kiritimatiellia bacterium]|nr:AraC family transcriptional regulator [Kiritimatiellia bacterium]